MTAFLSVTQKPKKNVIFKVVHQQKKVVISLQKKNGNENRKPISYKFLFSKSTSVFLSHRVKTSKEQTKPTKWNNNDEDDETSYEEETEMTVTMTMTDGTVDGIV